MPSAVIKAASTVPIPSARANQSTVPLGDAAAGCALAVVALVPGGIAAPSGTKHVTLFSYGYTPLEHIQPRSAAPVGGFALVSSTRLYPGGTATVVGVVVVVLVQYGLVERESDVRRLGMTTKAQYVISNPRINMAATNTASGTFGAAIPRQNATSLDCLSRPCSSATVSASCSSALSTRQSSHLARLLGAEHPLDPRCKRVCGPDERRGGFRLGLCPSLYLMRRRCCFTDSSTS